MTGHALRRRRKNEAVVRFADWLTNLTVQREVANGSGGGAGKARVVLCGHRCDSVNGAARTG